MRIPEIFSDGFRDQKIRKVVGVLVNHYGIALDDPPVDEIPFQGCGRVRFKMPTMVFLAVNEEG